MQLSLYILPSRLSTTRQNNIPLAITRTAQYSEVLTDTAIENLFDAFPAWLADHKHFLCPTRSRLLQSQPCQHKSWRPLLEQAFFLHRPT